MMELTTCAFIVTLISIVTATPYGYGVKGGASAISGAESRAAADSFGSRGDIPLSTFSGSFSKSSSSSSSSSSASSSSSSSSFSYNGFGSNPGPNGNAGCTSGCQNANNQAPTDNNADFRGYNAANSIAVAGSVAASEVDCQGPQCNSNSGKCLSEQCQPKVPIGASITDHDTVKKCSSGQCGLTSQSSPSASQYNDSDDIHFMAHTSKSAQDSKDHSFNDKTTGYSHSSECQRGNCGPSTINTQPNGAHGSSTPYAANSNSRVTPGYNLPATDLKAPNLNSDCQSGICTTNYDSSPTSYNVPIHGSPVGCTTPGCSSEFSSPSMPQLHYDNTKPETSEKKLPVYTGGFGGPAGLLKPNEFNAPISTTSKPIYFGNPSFSTPSNPVTGCKTANCIGIPNVGDVTSSTADAGTYNTIKESGTVTMSNNKPIYTGGFGGPAGMLKPGEFDIKVPVHGAGPSYNNHPSTTSIVCKTPNCNGYATKPNTDAESTSKIPPYTGSFGGPPGLLKPNEFNVYYSSPSMGDITPQSSFGVPNPITVPHHSLPGSTTNYRPIGVTYPGPLAVASVTPGYAITQPQHPTGISSAECKTGNCAIYPGIGTVVNAPSGPHGSFEGCKTGNCADYPVPGADVSAPSGSYDNTAMCKTGNCAGHPTSGSNIISETATGLYGHSTQSGCTTGNCAFPTNVVPSGPHSATYPNTAGQQFNHQYTGGFGGHSDTVPPSGSDSANCKSSNCADFPTANGNLNGQPVSKEQLPVYTGGFGGPSGLLKPNDYSFKPYITAATDKPLPDPSTCTSGNCSPKKTSPSSTGHNIGLNDAHATAASSASANAIAYSGGFGGPPGFLIPYDNGKVDVSKNTAGQNQISHYGGANIAGQTGPHSNTGPLDGSAAGTSAVSTANANSGTLGYNMQGNGIKGGAPCGGGCGGDYRNGLHGSGSSAAAGARSLSSSGAYGVGGSFASSSASAHSSAGAYTKGGYGKR